VNFLRKHWYDLGGILAIITITLSGIYHTQLTNYQLLMWLSLLSLFLHQLEEYRIVGTFPGMINRVMFKSNMPDRFPLNTNTAFIINVILGWGVYFLSALFAERAIWLGMATIIVSFGNIIAHCFIFNIKGRSIYNAGMATSIAFFIPIVYLFFRIIDSDGLSSKADFLIGIPLGIVFNVFGILKLIGWLANKNTRFIFEKRNLLTEDRKG